MHIQRRSDPPLNLKEWLLVAFIWALFFLQEQIKLIEFTTVGEYLPVWWCAVIPRFALIGWFGLLLILGKRFYLRSFYEKAALAILPIILVPLFLSSMLFYHEDIYSLLRSLFFLFGGLFLFPCLVMINPRHKVVYTLIHILFIETILVFLLIALQYYTGHPNFVKTITFRFDLQRIPVQILMREGLLLLCYILSCLIYIKNDILKLPVYFMLFCLLYYMISCWLTRSVTIQIGLLLGFVIFMVFKNRPAGFIRLSLLLVLGYSFLVAFKPSVISSTTSITMNMSSSIQQDVRFSKGTVSQRISGISYYWGEFLNSGMIGFGIIDSTDRRAPQKILSNKYSGFNLGDTGILDFLFRFGFPGLIFVIVVLFRMERDLRKTIPLIPQKYIILSNAVYLVIIFNLLSLPLSKAFLAPGSNIFYALLVFYVWQVKKSYSNYAEASYECR